MPPQDVFRLPLQVAVERRAHRRVRREPRRHADEIAEVRRAERIFPRPRGQRLDPRFGALPRRDEPAGLHPLQHVGLPLLGRLRMPVGPQARRRLRHAREQRGFRQAQVRRAFAEVAPGRRFDAHQVAAERRAVEVLRQDRAFVQPPFELQRAEGFDGFRRQRPPPRLRQADHLRGDRRRARDAPPACDVLRDGPRQRPHVHARMFPEAAVFRRHQRLRDPGVWRRHVARPAIETARRQLHAQRLAVTVRQHRRRIQARQFFFRKRRPAHRRGERGDGQRRRQDGPADPGWKPVPHGTTRTCPPTPTPRISGSYMPDTVGGGNA